MAKQAPKIPEIDPLATLNDEARKHMETMQAELDQAEGHLDAMEELGIDQSVLRERVEWGRKAVKVILDRLT